MLRPPKEYAGVDRGTDVGREDNLELKLVNGDLDIEGKIVPLEGVLPIGAVNVLTLR